MARVPTARSSTRSTGTDIQTAKSLRRDRRAVREDSGDAAGTPVNRLKTFPGDERHHRNASHRIGPPVAEPSIEAQADEKDRRQVGADPRLPRLGFECPAAELTRDPTLVVDQQRHDDQGQRGEHDADGRAFRGLPPDQRRDGLVEHVRGEQQETDANDPKGTPLSSFPAGLIEVTSQPPQGCEAARDLDRRVRPEADERDAPGQKPGRERDHALARVPGDGEVLKGAASADRDKARAILYRGPPSVILPYFIMISMTRR